jgi:hypothetical protein
MRVGRERTKGHALIALCVTAAPTFYPAARAASEDRMSGTSPPAPQTTAWSDPRALVSFFALALLATALGVAYVKGDVGTIQLVVGSIVTMAGTVVSYWMGSSHSSQSKDATIATLSGPAPGTTTTTTATTGPTTP